MAAGTEPLSRSTAAHAQSQQSPARPRLLMIAVWVLQFLLVLQFVMAGVLKLSGSPDMADMFKTIGAGEWLRYLVGSLELAGAAGLLIPRLRGVAALGLGALLVGAAVTNQLVLHTSPGFPLGLFAISALIAWARWSDTVSLLGGRSAPPRAKRLSAASER